MPSSVADFVVIIVLDWMTVGYRSPLLEYLLWKDDQGLDRRFQTALQHASYVAKLCDALRGFEHRGRASQRARLDPGTGVKKLIQLVKIQLVQHINSDASCASERFLLSACSSIFGNQRIVIGSQVHLAWRRDAPVARRRRAGGAAPPHHRRRTGLTDDCVLRTGHPAGV